MATKKKEPAAATKPRSKSTKSVKPAPVEAAAVEAAPVDSAPVEAVPVEAAEPALVVEVAPAARPSHDAIAARASQIWAERGGSAFDNWIQAERELGA